MNWVYVTCAESNQRLLRGAFDMLVFALNNKHLMTGPKGNSEICFPETLRTSRLRTHMDDEGSVTGPENDPRLAGSSWVIFRGGVQNPHHPCV